MDDTNECDNLIQNTLDDEYILVTENDLQQYEKQNYTSRKSDVDDHSSDEMLPSRWEVIKERAGKAAELAILVPVAIVVVPVIAPIAIGGLMFGFMLDDPNSRLAKLFS